MDLIPGWLPPNRENWEFIAWVWQFFPLFTVVQWTTNFYPQGKTSIESKFNLPGKWAWLVMESPGFMTVLYLMFTLPTKLGIAGKGDGIADSGLAVGNWTMAGLYTIHYFYRAILSPAFLNPSMSPIHPYVAVAAFSWQIMNGLSLGGWLAGYGPRTVQDWSGRLYFIEIGLVIWAWGLLGNMFHDDELREIRREHLRSQEKQAKEAQEKGIDEENKKKYENRSSQKVYKIPHNGLFRFVFYPHYLCEWIEWAGFWMIGGLNCIPARSFLINEISAMLPRAIQGKQWYLEKFGPEKVKGKKAIIPGLL